MEKCGARILHLKDIFEQMESNTDNLKVLSLPNHCTQGSREEEREDKEEEISVMRSVQLSLN